MIEPYASMSIGPATIVEPLVSRCLPELARIIYQQPIYPKNLYAAEIPGYHADYKRDAIDRQVRLMQERNICKAPSRG